MVPGESSVSIRARVEAARVRQNRRFAGTNLTCSADMGPAEIREYCIPLAEGQSLICSAMRQMHLSARGYHRALKVSRTIADPEHVDVIRRIIWQRRCSIVQGVGYSLVSDFNNVGILCGSRFDAIMSIS